LCHIPEELHCLNKFLKDLNSSFTHHPAVISESQPPSNDIIPDIETQITAQLFVYIMALRADLAHTLRLIFPITVIVVCAFAEESIFSFENSVSSVDLIFPVCQICSYRPAIIVCHLASQGLSNPGIATCVPKIHSAKQRMWCTTMVTGLGYWYRLATACLSQKAASACPYLCFILSPNTEFLITAGLVYWYHSWILLHCLRLMITSTMCRSYIYKHM
jgi:hypothetical protein